MQWFLIEIENKVGNQCKLWAHNNEYALQQSPMYLCDLTLRKQEIISASSYRTSSSLEEYGERSLYWNKQTKARQKENTNYILAWLDRSAWGVENGKDINETQSLSLLDKVQSQHLQYALVCQECNYRTLVSLVVVRCWQENTETDRQFNLAWWWCWLISSTSININEQSSNIIGRCQYSTHTLYTQRNRLYAWMDNNNKYNECVQLNNRSQ